MTSSEYRIGVIADTHGVLKPEVFDLFEGVDLILHAGDVCGDDLLIQLEAIAPVLAVNGNMDGRPDAELRPLWRTVETPIARIAMTHGHLPAAPSTALGVMKDFFVDFAPEIVIYGHSHIPKLAEVDGVRIFNPGSAGSARFGKGLSVGLIRGTPGREIEIEHISLTENR